MQDLGSKICFCGGGADGVNPLSGPPYARSFIHGVRINNEAASPLRGGRFPDRKWQHCLTAPCPFPLFR